MDAGGGSSPRVAMAPPLLARPAGKASLPRTTSGYTHPPPSTPPDTRRRAADAQSRLTATTPSARRVQRPLPRLTDANAASASTLPPRRNRANVAAPLRMRDTHAEQHLSPAAATSALPEAFLPLPPASSIHTLSKQSPRDATAVRSEKGRSSKARGGGGGGGGA